MTPMKCGHPETSQNIKYYKKNDGFTRKVCLTCKRDRNKVWFIDAVKARREQKNMPVDKDAPRRFEVALEAAANDHTKPQPNCITPIGESSKWIDWATEEENREPGETGAPTHQEAKEWCYDCPLLDLCTSAALAKRPYHGVRGSGLIFEFGKRI